MLKIKQICVVWVCLFCGAHVSLAQQQVAVPGQEQSSVQQNGSWGQVGQKVEETADALGEATKKTAHRTWHATRGASKNAWNATRQKSSEIAGRVEDRSSEAWQATKEKSVDIYDQTRTGVRKVVDQGRSKLDTLTTTSQNTSEQKPGTDPSPSVH